MRLALHQKTNEIRALSFIVYTNFPMLGKTITMKESKMIKSYEPGQKVTIKGKELYYIGHNRNVPYFYEITSTNLSTIGTHSNTTSSANDFTVIVTKGSQIGFSQTLGISVSGSAGIPFVAKGKVTVSGEIGFTQAFSSSVSQQVGVKVEPGKTVAVYEAEIQVQYYFLLDLMGKVEILQPYKADIISTGMTESAELEPQT